jgi:hypothetical protein
MAARGMPACVSPSTIFGAPAIFAIALPIKASVAMPARALPVQISFVGFFIDVLSPDQETSDDGVP